MLITTSMLSTVWIARPIRKRAIFYWGAPGAPQAPQALVAPRLGRDAPRFFARLSAGRMRHVFPVVESHVAGDQRPLADFRADPGDGVGSPDGHSRDVLVEPGSHLI